MTQEFDDEIYTTLLLTNGIIRSRRNLFGGSRMLWNYVYVHNPRCMFVVSGPL